MSLYDVSPSSTTRSNHFSHRSSICLSDIRITSPKKTSGRKKDTFTSVMKEKYHIKKSESVITPRRSRLSSTKNKKGRKKCKKHVTFSEDLLMIIYIESFKKYNFLNTAGEPDDVKCKCLVF